MEYNLILMTITRITHMSPRWGLGVYGMAIIAPLGLQVIVYNLILNTSRFTFHAASCASGLRHRVQREGRTAPAERGVDPIGDASGGD